MHYYSFNIGDYRRRTSGFTLLEHGVYRQLMDEYYLDEKPLPESLNLIYRKLGVKSESEKSVVEEILNYLFVLKDGGWHHKHCDEVIENYHSKADTARENGKKGGRPKRDNNNPEKPSGLITETDGKPADNLPESESQTNHKPLTNNHKPNIPYQLIADAYNNNFADNVSGSTRVNVVSPKRKTAIKKIWNLKPNQEEERKSTNNVGYWERYFEYSSTQAGLNGGKATKDFDWIADFDALINFNKYVKNIEGGYE